MRQISTLIGNVARRVAAVAGRILRGFCNAYVASLDQPGIYLAIGNQGTRYVGQTRTTILRRWREHIGGLRRNVHHNTPVQKMYNRGERFVIIPLEAVPHDMPSWFFDQREQYWIKVLQD